MKAASKIRRLGLILIAAAAGGLALGSASADITLSELVVELQAGTKITENVEVTNSGSDRVYVALEPREITRPGQLSQSERTDPDPAVLGLLVSPARMILEPGQKKLARIASLAPTADVERVYRVTVKPVVGPLSSNSSGIKMLVGYDMLVLVRPNNVREHLASSKTGNTLLLRNDGNSSVELLQGRQCDSGNHCISLPGKRLYSGAQWTQKLPSTGPVEYVVKSPAGQKVMTFR